MLLSFLDKGLAKLELGLASIQGQGLAKARADLQLYSPLKFPTPPEGTRALCRRCLTLLSHFVASFGDGSDFQPLRIAHSLALRDLSYAFETESTDFPTLRRDTNECLICLKVYLLRKHWKAFPFYEKAHIEWEKVLKSTPMEDWHLVWAMERRHQDNLLHVELIMVHKGGDEQLLGGFTIEPERDAQGRNLEDLGVISTLDGDHQSPESGRADLDFSTTLSKGTLSLATTWMNQCSILHTRCDQVFGSDQLQQPDPWFPDRLVQVTQASNGIAARVVLKSDPVHFPQSHSTQLRYLSLSHCWGPPPSPLAPLGGRKGSVLTEETIREWTNELPVKSLPKAFQQAIEVCTVLGFEYIWIDSLCIMQDSKEDWETQSAVMGDVYKFAFLNIAALSSTSDYSGFIFPRDTRITFGFRCSLAKILGKDVSETNHQQKSCILLKDTACLHWDYNRNLKGSQPTVGPLYTRAWVFQERSLARRTLTFTNSTVYWSCDEKNLCERTGWEGSTPGGLRRILHSVSRETGIISQNTVPEISRELVETVDYHWHSTVTDYTSCKLTQHSDKLIAVGSIARELSNTVVLQYVPYYAGLWGVNMAAQLAWITVDGASTPPRKQVGEEGYSAPSWSWASIEAAVQPRCFATATSTALIKINEVQLADVLQAETELTAEFRFGCVKAGWIRLRAVIHRVRSGVLRGGHPELVDDATREKLNFCSDTVEGIEMVRRGHASKIVWMPLSVTFNNGIEGHCLILREVEGYCDGDSSPRFVKKGEKVYRRMGTGNFWSNDRNAEPYGSGLQIGFLSWDSGG